MSEIDLELLKEAGLTAYESKCYVALLKYGSMKGSQVADKTEVPKTRIYDVLKSLERKGLASRIQERPMKFSPIQPKKGLKPLYKREKKRIDHAEKEAVSALENLDQIGSRDSVEQKVEIVQGQRNMFEQLNSRVEEVHEEVFGLVLGRVPPKSSRLKIRELLERGGKVRLMTARYDSENAEAYEKMAEKAEIRYHQEYFSFIIIVLDRNTALINIANPEDEMDRISIFFESEGLAEAMAEYLESIWKKTKPLKEVEPRDNG